MCLGDLEEEQHTLLVYSYRLRSFSAERRHANHPVKKVAAHLSTFGIVVDLLHLHIVSQTVKWFGFVVVDDPGVGCYFGWAAASREVKCKSLCFSRLGDFCVDISQLPKRKLCPIPILLRVLLACLSCFPLWLCFFYGITTTSPQTTAAAGLLQSVRAEYF